MKFSPIFTGLLLSASGMVSAASYEVQEIPLSDVAAFHFASAIDETNTTVSSVRTRFNPVVDLTLFNASNHPTLPDADNLDPNNFTTDQLAIIANDLITNTTRFGLFLQKLANDVPFRSDGTDVSYINGFDQESADTNGFTFSLRSRVNDITNGTHVVGAMTSPYREVSFTNDSDVDLTYVINDFSWRGFVQVGQQVTPLVPTFTGAGGFSFANAINANLQVAGTQSIAASSRLEEFISNCNDDDERGDEPVEACIYNVFNSVNFRPVFNTSTSFLYTNVLFESRPTNLMDVRPTMWQLDANGQVISSQVYDLLHTPDSFNFNTYARANDINANGTMVGFSTVPESEREQLVAVATVFENGQTTRLFDVDDIVASYAMAINDSDIVVGFYPAIFNDLVRNRMFVFDRNTQTLTRPSSFFVSANTHPRAINNNGLVVGDAESEVFDTSTRLTSGFLYNINDDSFVNLNDLLPCDSPYTIISANDINDAGVIVADAQVRRPRRDITGAQVTGDNAGDGDFVVSVKLNPTGNAPSQCETESDPLFERQGASLQSFWVFLMSLAVFIRLFLRRS